MRLKLLQIGNSVGVILPEDELIRRGLQVGDQIDLKLSDDPFWDELRQFTKEQRRAADKKELAENDFTEWEKI